MATNDPAEPLWVIRAIHERLRSAVGVVAPTDAARLPADASRIRTPWLVSSSGRALLGLGGSHPFGLEPAGQPVGPGQVGGQPLPGLLSLRVQALELEQVPVAQQRPQDLVVVDAQVIDASLSQLQRLVGEAVDADAGHVEANHLL